MKSEKLLYAIGEIDDDLVKNALSMKKRKVHQARRKWVIVTTCVSMGLIIISILSINKFRFLNNERSTVQTQIIIDYHTNVSDLLMNEKASSSEILNVQVFPVKGRIATYHQVTVSTKGMELLPDSLGKPLEEVDNCYRLLGHNELQYLIVQNGDDFTLWEFASFLVWDDETFDQVKNDFLKGKSEWSNYPWFSLEMDFTAYSYDMVLKEIYGLTSADAISSIVVGVADMDNTEAGLALQNEIGEITITDKNDIEDIYKIISTMNCLDDDNWEKIGIGSDTSTLEKVRQGRYLTINFNDNMQIDSLKYTGISKQFYEYGGVAYNVLDNNEAKKIEKILKI